MKNRKCLCLSSWWIVLLLVTTGFTAAESPMKVNELCEGLMSFFNTINQAMPMRVNFPYGSAPPGINYPSGNITIASAKKSSQDCVAYTFEKSTIVRIILSAPIKITLPKGEGYIVSNVNLTASEATVELHYAIINTSVGTVAMKPIMTEVRGLGEVEAKQDGQRKEMTEMAEDIIRPILFNEVNKFASQSLGFLITPYDYDPSGAAYEAFRTIFKAYMYNLHTGHDNNTTLKTRSPHPWD